MVPVPYRTCPVLVRVLVPVLGSLAGGLLCHWRADNEGGGRRKRRKREKGRGGVDRTSRGPSRPIEVGVGLSKHGPNLVFQFFLYIR